MRGRKSRPSKTIKEQVERRGEEFGRRAEAAVDALGNAVDRIQDLSATAGRRMSRRGRAATHRSAETAKDALEQARHAVRQVPDWDQMADMARRTGDRLMPERAKQRRKAERRRRIRMAAGGFGLAGVGAAALAWLGAARRAAMRTEPMGPDTDATTRPAATGMGATPHAGSTSSTSSVPTNPGSTTQPTGSGNGHTGPGRDA